MKILLTNDDGYGADGLEALVDVLSKNHDVWVVAPSQDRSAVSHGFTMRDPLCLVEKSSQKYTCSGFPSDCVDVGSKVLLNGKPDVVISGINKGANIGTDIIFSGTVAAARHASLQGIPGIAVSLTSENNTWNYKPLANFIAKNIEKLITLCEEDIFVNINAQDSVEIKGWQITIPSKRKYQDFPEVYYAPNGNLYSFFNGGKIQTDKIEGTDYICVEEGYVSISRILTQPSSAVINEYLQNLDFMV